MTELLQKAIAQPWRSQTAKIQNLPDEEQDTIATIILEELEDEKKWETAFADSQDVLATLAAEAMAEYRAGNTQELNPETL